MAKRKATRRDARRGVGRRLVEYLRGTWYEMKKVTWPTRQEAGNLTLIVLAAMMVLALILGFVDWIFSQAFNLIIGL